VFQIIGMLEEGPFDGLALQESKLTSQGLKSSERKLDTADCGAQTP
jgi:hypothetical protein